MLTKEEGLWSFKYDKVFLKVSPMKGIQKFEVRGKLSPRYVGPYEIIEKLNPVANRLDFLVEL